MGRGFVKTSLLILLFCGSTLAQQQQRSNLVIKILDVSQSGVVSVDITNSSGSAIRLWDEANSWGAARWRILRIREAKLDTFFQNPHRKFTVNGPIFNELPAGGHARLTLDLNGGNWCFKSACSSFGEHGIGGNSIGFKPKDCVIAIYDVPLSYDPEARKLHAWDGVIAALTTVR